MAKHELTTVQVNKLAILLLDCHKRPEILIENFTHARDYASLTVSRTQLLVAFNSIQLNLSNNDELKCLMKSLPFAEITEEYPPLHSKNKEDDMCNKKWTDLWGMALECMGAPKGTQEFCYHVYQWGQFLPKRPWSDYEWETLEPIRKSVVEIAKKINNSIFTYVYTCLNDSSSEEFPQAKLACLTVHLMRLQHGFISSTSVVGPYALTNNSPIRPLCFHFKELGLPEGTIGTLRLSWRKEVIKCCFMTRAGQTILRKDWDPFSIFVSHLFDIWSPRTGKSTLVENLQGVANYQVCESKIEFLIGLTRVCENILGAIQGKKQHEVLVGPIKKILEPINSKKSKTIRWSYLIELKAIIDGLEHYLQGYELDIDTEKMVEHLEKSALRRKIFLTKFQQLRIQTNEEVEEKHKTLSTAETEQKTEPDEKEELVGEGRIYVNLSKFNKGTGSYDLFIDLLGDERRDGVTNDVKKYGKRQPQSLRDMLRSNGYENVAGEVKLRKEKIKLDIPFLQITTTEPNEAKK